jgi:cell wall-associated NlpC family hydrolase
MKGVVMAWLSLALALCLVFCCFGIYHLITTVTDQLSTAADTSTALDLSRIPSKYVTWVEKAGKECALITAPLIAAQIEAESNWNPNAESLDSHDNPIAQGISQFTPGTWAAYGVDGDGDGDADVWSPPDAIMAQAKYDCYLAGQVTKLLKAKKIGGVPVELTLAAYNAGLGRVISATGVPNITETKNYINRILQLVTKYTAIAAVGGPFGQAVVAYAQTQIGVPYSWGGGGIKGKGYGIAQGAFTLGFDCSSLVQYAVYHASGNKLVLPRVTYNQVKTGKAVPRDQVQVGDAIYFDIEGTGKVSHVGIYVGNNHMIHAPRTGENVQITDIGTRYWTSIPQFVRRFG